MTSSSSLICSFSAGADSSSSINLSIKDFSGLALPGLFIALWSSRYEKNSFFQIFSLNDLGIVMKAPEPREIGCQPCMYAVLSLPALNKSVISDTFLGIFCWFWSPPELVASSPSESFLAHFLLVSRRPRLDA